MLRIPLLCVLLVLSLVSGGAHAQASRDLSRGELLYANHCIACHTTQVHWREKKAATDWKTLLVEVRRWQGAALLGWSDAEIAEVARYLNDRYYRVLTPG